MFSLLSDRPSVVRNFLQGEDTLNSLAIAKQLGAEVVTHAKGHYTITPPKEIKEPEDVLDCGNAGTGIRLYAGLLSCFDGFFILSGDKYLRRRPMRRITEPLKRVGAQLDGRDNGNLAPLTVRGGAIKAFNYSSKVASAQVKSAMIFTALKADGISYFDEPRLSRDHSERMLQGMGARIERDGTKLTIHPIQGPLAPLDITVPADPSSAFFFAVAAAITPSAKVLLKGLTLNPTRIEAFKALERMGAKITYTLLEDKYEPIGDIEVAYAPLKGVVVDENIAWLIDELPALSIAMAVASGISVVKNAKELRVKESDRIDAVAENLKKAGVKIKTFEDGYEIEGGAVKPACFNSYGDHRIAMSFALLGMLSGGSVIEDTECIMTSFPNFTELLSQICSIDSEL